MQQLRILHNKKSPDYLNEKTTRESYLMYTLCQGLSKKDFSNLNHLSKMVVLFESGHLFYLIGNSNDIHKSCTW